MTLIVALKYMNGTVLASDSRVIIGGLKRDRAIKLEPLTSDIGIASAGLVGATDDILKTVKAFCNSSPLLSFDSVVSYLSDTALDWHKKNADKLGEEDETEEYLAFIAVSPERIRKVLPRGYSEEADNYDCDGTGKPYAEYILGNFYKENLNEDEAKELAVYAIVETSKMDPSVGEDIELLVFPKGEQCKIISKRETEDIKQRLAPTSKIIAETQHKTVETIVDLRDAINSLFEAKFNFKLFNTSERAVFQMMKPCRSEEEFTSNIAALALLVDQLNVKEMKKTVGKKEGSINVLEAYTGQCIADFPPEIIQTFRDIMTLRSKKFPIHSTDSKFLEVVIKITGVYPPSWPDLYIKTLNLYSESLSRFLGCLSK
jgi:20S proteasome alpha/beta subunit